MLHTTIAMISSSALSHLNWGAVAASLQFYAMHVMDVHGGIFP